MSPSVPFSLRPDKNTAMEIYQSHTASHNSSSSDVVQSLRPVYEILEALPVELVHAIVTHLTDLETLCSLARVSKFFQELAEPSIYRRVVIRNGSQAQQFCISIRRNLVRATYVRHLINACHLDSFHGLFELAEFVPVMTSLENLVLETPDCNRVGSEARAPWIEQQEVYRRLFDDALAPNTSTLLKLRSCTLHLIDSDRSIYPLRNYSIIFLHPTITHLTISCASIGPPAHLHPRLLRQSANTTSLQTLDLIECDFHPEGLHKLLSLPRDLISLTITEATHYAQYIYDRVFSGLATSEILHPVSHFQPNIRHLRVARLGYKATALFAIPKLDLTPFAELTSVEFAHAHPNVHETLPNLDWCELVHRAGPQANTGGPNTSTLTYTDIPMHWWERGIAFFACAFRHKVSHGIENLKTLRLVLTDDELGIYHRGFPDEVVTRLRERRRAAVDNVKLMISRLGALGRTSRVGVRVIVDFIAVNGETIPPYLTGECVPEISNYYDSADLTGDSATVEGEEGPEA